MIILLFFNLKVELTGTLNDWLFDFFLKLGNLVCPLKKFLNAISKNLKDHCNDCELTSFKNIKSSFVYKPDNSFAVS